MSEGRPIQRWIRKYYISDRFKPLVDRMILEDEMEHVKDAMNMFEVIKWKNRARNANRKILS
jgi:nitrogen-specific signal transduction histidine kinase